MAVDDFLVTKKMCETHRYTRMAYPNNRDYLTGFCDDFAAYLGRPYRFKQCISPNSNKWNALNIVNKRVMPFNYVYKYIFGSMINGVILGVEGFCDITNYLYHIDTYGKKTNCLYGLYHFMDLGGVVRIGSLDFTKYDYADFVQEVNWTI